MELVMTIHVRLSKNIYKVNGDKMNICMLPFTGTAEGMYFNGMVIGEGVDTQKIYPDGKIELSARYMLEGEDFKGNRCSVFVENNGESLEKCIPLIVTDSADLQFLSEAELISNVIPTEIGVDVRIYKL
ncbi:DUF3237 family protein [Anaeromicropila herbilytica]|uniref:Uncharacterized protein n=1 Tax=Anaeromicropila herbilytica TaxID=2785025 RepID=A0A7R7IAW2_9FIRM|nr:DUF3237 family protein [Anaeromicropila herbilytica]BCN28893.1 hypothetical protein bsdtb5_01880 [Anaeromicropila herbilytica]